MSRQQELAVQIKQVQIQTDSHDTGYQSLEKNYLRTAIDNCLVNQKLFDKEQQIEKSAHSHILCGQEHLNNYCKLYEKDLKYGLISAGSHQIVSFEIEQIRPILQSLQKLSLAQWRKTMENFPNLRLKEKKIYADMIILHDILAMIINRYLFVCKQSSFIVKEEEIELHQNFSMALFAASTFLDIKKGMTANIYYNWCPTTLTHIEHPEQFGYKDFRLRWYLTEYHEQQWYFFGASIIATFHLSQVINNCVRIQHLIEQHSDKVEQIRLLLEKSAQRWRIINSEMNVMLKNLSGDIFYKKLRPLLAGFERVTFKGVEEDSNEVRVSSSGGTGGYDPSFQTFQKAFGIEFHGDLQQTQNTLFNEGMPERHRAAILYWKSLLDEDKPNIRKFCSQNNLQIPYNHILQLYSVFLYIHSMVIQKFILSQIPGGQRANSLGTGGTMIKKIQERYKRVEQQFLS